MKYKGFIQLREFLLNNENISSEEMENILLSLVEPTEVRK